MTGRPRIYENLRNTTITIEADLIEKSKERGINISSVCREALITALNDPEIRKRHDKFDRIDKETQAVVHKVYRDHKNLRGCFSIIKRMTGLTVGQMEFLNWFEKYDNKVSDKNGKGTPDKRIREIT